MDWIDKYAEKLKRYIRNASMVRAAVVYFFIAMLGCMACTSLTVNLTSLWIVVMSGRFPYPDEAIGLLQKIRELCPYFFMAVSVLIAGSIYVENKVKAALLEVSCAIKYMAAGDLSYEMAWQSEDELGMLVRDVEDLRETLKKEKLNQWRLSEDQRKINAAFAHDIRTPLTVMKGYTEFLKKYVPQGKVTDQMLWEKLDRISYQGDRLLAFSGTMATLQRMENREVHCSRWETAEICNRIREAAEGMKKENVRISFLDNGNVQESVFVDLELLLEAVENVLQNAFRYAREYIEVTVQHEKNRLVIYVRDDGEGFSEKALREADAAYFREGKEGEEEGHFGIGLSITKMLSEKHGGGLKLFNSIEGGAVTAVSFFAG
ncbi:MAG: HAMP domain-containing histidine kinase [Lachnospiraceae bacterium]|nr:HAMP domain-containing histidine kinase [Lachnospiraceae bacterium]